MTSGDGPSGPFPTKSLGRILGVDPGPAVEQTGAVIWDTRTGTVTKLDRAEKEGLFKGVVPDGCDAVVIESMSPIGAILGQATIDTIFWTGYLYRALGRQSPYLVTRRDAKRILLGRTSGTDRDFRLVLEEKFGPKGTTKAPGALYGISGHDMAALAIAVAWGERSMEKGR